MKRYQYWLPCHYRDDSQIFLRGATTRMVPIMAEVVASPCFFFFTGFKLGYRLIGPGYSVVTFLVILRSFVKNESSL